MASACPVDDGIAGHTSARSGNSFTFFTRFEGTLKSAETAPVGQRVRVHSLGEDHRSAIRRGRR